ncbi:MAG: substrate-binding domain-containing protein [Bacteroidetes bacterium]|nr:substrate-binding domain-containing protein [Bacteroidota bacterium]
MKISKIDLFVAFAALLCSCGGNENRIQTTNEETVNSGTAVIICDETIMPLISAAKPYYDSAFPNAKITLQPANAREAMRQLFSGKTRAIIIARDYLHDEDSAMQIHNIAKHQRFLFAVDGLVLFARKDFPIDTLSKEQITAAMNTRLPIFTQPPSHSEIEPSFAGEISTSSLFGNLMNEFSGGKPVTRPMKFFATADSVAEYVKSTNGAIGFGYMSKFGRDTTVKLIRIGFSDSTGKRVYPQTVHPGNIVRGKYPFSVNYYGYLLEDRMNLPWGFFTFMRTDKRVQQSFLNAGIAPAFAKLELIEQ